MATNASKHQKSMSLDDYLAFEQQSLERHEFVAGEIYAFAGGTRLHNRLAGNVYRRLADAADDAGCVAFVGDVKLQAAADVIYYPDVMVTCDADDSDPLIVTRPTIVVEVLSASTRSIDLREKVFLYRQIDSLETYLIVEQEERKVYRHWRDEERLWWSETVPTGATIPLPGLGIELTLDDIYRNIPPSPSSPNALA